MHARVIQCRFQLEPRSAHPPAGEMFTRASQELQMAAAAAAAQAEVEAAQAEVEASAAPEKADDSVETPATYRLRCAREAAQDASSTAMQAAKAAEDAVNAAEEAAKRAAALAAAADEAARKQEAGLQKRM